MRTQGSQPAESGIRAHGSPGPGMIAIHDSARGPNCGLAAGKTGRTNPGFAAGVRCLLDEPGGSWEADMYVRLGNSTRKLLRDEVLEYVRQHLELILRTQGSQLSRTGHAGRTVRPASADNPISVSRVCVAACLLWTWHR